MFVLEILPTGKGDKCKQPKHFTLN